MGLSEFENELKRKLEERTIVPSKTAWEKVAEQLDDQPAKSNYKVWYGMAAILVIALIASVTFFMEKPTDAGTGVVDNNKDKDKPVLMEETVPQLKEEEKEPVNEQYVTRTQKDVKITPIGNGIKEDSGAIENKQGGALAETVSPEIKDISIEDQKVNDIVNSLAQMQQQGTEITDAMVDSLLLKAQRELAKERRSTLLSKKNSTDAMAQALLEEVEYDLDRSFKDKVFDALQSGFIKVKTAVAERNQ